MKEKASRDTQMSRSMHEMGEMKRAQELRVDEFSIQKLRESHEIIQRLTSYVQELQERMNYLNDSGEFQERRVELQWTIFHTFPVNQQGCQVHALCQPATHGIDLDHRKTFLQIHVTNTPSKNSSICDTKCYRRGSRALLTPVAREEERIGNTIRMTTFACWPSTMRSW